MKRKIQIILLALALGTTMVACNNPDTNDEPKTEDTSKVDSNNDKENVESEEAKSTEKRDFSDKLQGEDGVVRWVRVYSGNLMMTMAEKNGYLEEYGLKVDQVHMQTSDESFSAVAGNQVDIVSNAGTAIPIQRIMSGDDLVIFGGHMVEGSMSIIGRKGAEWDGIQTLIGKKVAGSPIDVTVAGQLLEMGYDPVNDIEWSKLPTEMDNPTAVKNGVVEYATVGTSLTHQAKTDPDLELLAKYGQLMPDYSCCRMETAERFIDEKPNTTKALLKALLRGMRDYEKDPEAASKLLAEELDVPVEFVEAYTLDKEGYKISPDPLYNSCVRQWVYLNELEVMGDNPDRSLLRSNIAVDLYKEALDEVIEEVGDEDPEYWDGVVKYFEEQNSMFYDEEAENKYVEETQNTIRSNREKNIKENKEG